MYNFFKSTINTSTSLVSSAVKTLQSGVSYILENPKVSTALALCVAGKFLAEACVIMQCNYSFEGRPAGDGILAIDTLPKDPLAFCQKMIGKSNVNATSFVSMSIDPDYCEFAPTQGNNIRVPYYNFTR